MPWLLPFIDVPDLESSLKSIKVYLYLAAFNNNAFKKSAALVRYWNSMCEKHEKLNCRLSPFLNIHPHPISARSSFE